MDGNVLQRRVGEDIGDWNVALGVQGKGAAVQVELRDFDDAATSLDVCIYIDNR